jgi:hypothetical protein
MEVFFKISFLRDYDISFLKDSRSISHKLRSYKRKIALANVVSLFKLPKEFNSFFTASFPILLQT